MSIIQLPQSTTKLITSSQVITSVSSAVKELIENSLDSGASNIDVKLDNYGLDRIEVKDDGAGINPSNAVFMGLPHHTSKIKAFSDIESLESYGFRGEALNALCQVGNVTVTTATSEDTTGMIYVLDKNGQVTSSVPTHKFKGTSVVVAYLFKNIPVRRQFFSNNKRAKEELRQVENIVKALGVINPAVRFTLHHNKCMIWQKTSGTELRQGMVYMLGYSPARELHELKTDGPEVKIEALVPRIGCDISILSKGSPDWSMVFINKRPVHCKNVYKVVCEYVNHCFGERALQRKSPIFLVSFTLSPTRLDVNLEPNKTRVLVKDEDLLIEDLRRLLTQYYGSPTAKEDIAKLESPAKKRRIDSTEEHKPKPSDALFDKQDELNGGKFEVATEPLRPVYSVLPKYPQNEVAVRRTSVHEKENVVEIRPAEGISSKPWTFKTWDQSMTAEKWSMGHVKEPDGNYIQGPAVFVTGRETHLVKENVPSPFASTSSINSLNSSTDKERQADTGEFSTTNKERQTGLTNPPATEEERETVFSIDPDRVFSTMEKEEFEKEWSAENSHELFAPVKTPLFPVVTCPTKSAVGPPPVSNCSEQLGPVISPPRPRNEKKSKKTLQLAPRDDDIDMSVSSQMGRREFAGFTKFARDARPQIILENPGIAFTKIAVMLSDRWKNLPPHQREMYDKKARDHILDRKMQQSGDLSQSKLPFEQKEKRSEHQKKSITSHCFQRLQTPYRVSIDIIKERTQPQTRRKPTEDNCTAIGHLHPSGGWVCLKGKEISLISPYRLQEVVLTHRLLATHAIPLRPLSSPQRLEEKDLGADNWKLLLSMDRTVCDLDGKTMVVSSPIIARNGFRIQLAETEGNVAVLLTHVADTISFYGIQDLLETLLLATTNGINDLTLCRPLRVVNHIKGEAVRICRQDPSVMERHVLEELLLYWKTHLSSTDLCLHSKPIWTSVHTLSAT